ncbi:hypothetical protein [Bradyrhizobium genosp. A]|uniref:hypothetical protein n=1 Tax=Bradyrhizobium genosp. A TaxID=83626 RepID=UPI003CE8DA97
MITGAPNELSRAATSSIARFTSLGCSRQKVENVSMSAQVPSIETLVDDLSQGRQGTNLRVHVSVHLSSSSPQMKAGEQPPPGMSFSCFDRRNSVSF